MGSLDLSDGEVPERKSKLPRNRKHDSNKSIMGRKTTKDKDKSIHISESEDDNYYAKSKKHKSSKKNKTVLKNNSSDSELSDNDKISKKYSHSQQESKITKARRHYNKESKYSDSSDTERNVSQNKEKKRKYSKEVLDINDDDEKNNDTVYQRNEKDHKNKKLKGKSRNERDNDESDRSPSPKRNKKSKRSEESRSFRDKENKRERKISPGYRKSKNYKGNKHEDSIYNSNKDDYCDRIQSPGRENESDFTDKYKEKKSKVKNGGDEALDKKKRKRENYNKDEEMHRRKPSNIDLGKERSLSPRDGDDDAYDERFQKPIKYKSYWSGGVNVRKNSDNYWNKYPIKDKSGEVGPRYYGGPPKKTAEEKSKQVDSEVEKDPGNKSEKLENAPSVKPARKNIDLLTSKTGGAYIPPAKLRMMQESITDKASAAYQRLAWEALKKSIQGLVNKINTSNIVPIVKELQRENIVRGRGLLCRAIIQAQATSPTFTHVYAALVSAINTKFPNIGELLLKRLVVQFRRGFKRNDKTICITAATFIAHLVNHQVAHEILALEILTLLVESPTDDSVEVAIAFLKECGMKLTEVSKKGIAAIFDMLRNILHEGNLDKRVQYMIEVMFQIRKDDFKAYPSIVEGLNLVYEEDQFMHLITLEEEIDTQDILNVFKFDPEYEANEAKYKSLVVEDSDEGSSDGSGASGDEDDDSDDDSEEDDETGEKQSVIIDKTETNLVALRRTIYLTIQSSLDFEECAHKLLRMQIKPGQEIEMCHMFLDCCAEQRTYEKFYGLLAQRFCQINRTYIGPFEETFRDSYATIHRIETDKLRNIAKLFAHLFFTDAISWEVLSTIRLNEEDTTSSSRIFIKILFLELSEYMGLAKLNQRVKDPSLQTALEGLFPRDNPKNTRFAINFFTSIGLGGLTDELREHLKTQPKPSIAVPQLVEALSSSSDSSSSDSDSSDSSSDSSSSDSSSDSEDSTPKKKTKKRKNVPSKQTQKKKSKKTKSKKPSR